jgi:uncharacterized protein with HEPN domain
MLQMRDMAREALELAGQHGESGFYNSRVTHLALIKLTEMIGEAATRLPPELRSQYSAVPWNQIIGMRNRTIHGYDSYDPATVWKTLSEDVPELLRHLDAILGTDAG